ncbi:hypothetical protein ESZ91_07225 [Candidatus Borkfalkia ceftriaxoniphila]|uniref:Uncharacterized protein n=1 Tax=Candidatus Borkfalkia ceftriaxoniphila TaxID=2508949 RepID=A0A4Q2KDV2_9FIRM|nr:hypothetical protein [Candidatus Borkfalkia ceftriaxoniphila]RXZ62177.1 hypothetical protein ESZ91_07225 [Candidatus Borkfalkia ceftriaxoniphila]
MPQKIKRRSDPCGVSDYKGILSCCNARKQAAQRPLFFAIRLLSARNVHDFSFVVSADIVARENNFVNQPLTNAEIWNTMKV